MKHILIQSSSIISRVRVRISLDLFTSLSSTYLLYLHAKAGMTLHMEMRSMQCSSEMRHAEIICDPRIRYAARRYDNAVAARRNDMRPADMIMRLRHAEMITLLLILLYLIFLPILRG